MGRSFKEFMEERREVDRWFVLKVAMAGAFMGTLFGVMYMIFAVGMTW